MIIHLTNSKTKGCFFALVKGYQDIVKLKKIFIMSTITTIPQLKSMLANDNVKARFKEILGKKAPGFISSIVAVANSNTLLQKAEPQSIMNAAVVAATLDLPINPNLGFAYVVPYGNQAQFQMGWRGFVQLAMRSGQYKTINVNEIYEGEIKKSNRFTGEYEFGERASDKIVGYMAYFSLINGFEKFLYMSKEDCEKHGRKFSQTYKRGTGIWSTDFDSMAKKTVLKMLLSKFGILSIEMQRAQTFDQAIIKDNLAETDIDEAEVSYNDNPDNEEARRNAMKEALQEAEVVDENTGELFNTETK
nr:MAG TPA: RecT protein [Caudoviricetes sp.]